MEVEMSTGILWLDVFLLSIGMVQAGFVGMLIERHQDDIAGWLDMLAQGIRAATEQGDEVSADPPPQEDHDRP